MTEQGNWFVLSEMRKSQADKDGTYTEKWTLKWKGIAADYMVISMTFDNEMTMVETLKQYGLKAVLGEKMNLKISAPKRLESFKEKEE